VSTMTPANYDFPSEVCGVEGSGGDARDVGKNARRIRRDPSTPLRCDRGICCQRKPSISRAESAEPRDLNGNTPVTGELGEVNLPGMGTNRFTLEANCYPPRSLRREPVSKPPLLGETGAHMWARVRGNVLSR